MQPEEEEEQEEEEIETDMFAYPDAPEKRSFTTKLKSAISQLRRAFVDDPSDANMAAIQERTKKAKVTCTQANTLNILFYFST